MENPVSPGSHPTLTCTIVLDSTVDREVQIEVSWSGPVYGFGEYTVTAPVVNSTAEVPTYTSTAALDADESFYDSGQYSCTAVVSPVSNRDFIHSSSATSTSIPGEIINITCSSEKACIQRSFQGASPSSSYAPLPLIDLPRLL